MMKLKQLICRLEEMSQAESRGATEKELIQGVKFVFALMLIKIDLDLINHKSNLSSTQHFNLFNLVSAFFIMLHRNPPRHASRRQIQTKFDIESTIFSISCEIH